MARLRELVPEGSEVFVNTSETLDAIGYTEYMHGNDRYINLHYQMMSQPDPASQREFRRKTTTADYFVSSVQAIAETGEIVIASSSGSQIEGSLLRRTTRHSRGGHSKNLPHPHSDAESRTRGFTLERHDRWLEGRSSATRHSRGGHSKNLPHPVRRRVPHARLHAGAPRPLAGRPGRGSHPHRQIPGDRARARGRSHFHGPHSREHRLVNGLREMQPERGNPTLLRRGAPSFTACRSPWWVARRVGWRTCRAVHERPAQHVATSSASKPPVSIAPSPQVET